MTQRVWSKHPENLGSNLGSPTDRGSADAYYGRPKEPHYYPNGTGNEPKITELTKAEIRRYNQGYNGCTDRKDRG